MTGAFVLIESDWNLKEEKKYIANDVLVVLIESDWNLKRSCMNVIYLYDSLY